jgi:hypothetical protein
VKGEISGGQKDTELDSIRGSNSVDLRGIGPSNTKMRRRTTQAKVSFIFLDSSFLLAELATEIERN